MKIAARGGNRGHAPANTRLSLVSAWTGGADILCFTVRLSASDRLVLAEDDDTLAATGAAGSVRALKVSELRKLNYAQGFVPRGSAAGEFSYIDPAKPDRRHPIDVLDEMIDDLPEEASWMIDLRGMAGDDDSYTKGAEVLAGLLNGRNMTGRTILTSDHDVGLNQLRALCPAARFAVANTGADTQAADFLIARSAAGIGLDSLRTDLAHLDGLAATGKWPSGIILELPGALDEARIGEVAKHAAVAVLCLDSTFDAAAHRPSFVKLDESFAGQTVNKASFALGYAKANRFARVTWDNGVHIDIAPYDGAFPKSSDDDVARLKWDLINIGREWPFYSGGGVGVVHGIVGDFSAEVDYRVKNVGQATTLEMALVNVDPGAHRDDPPFSFRDKDSFYDPHGAPPFVGVEHDEDDGFRINWNLGVEYDNNQYGRPAGDGRTPRGARMRLERRGSWFSAYYRNAVDGQGNALAPRDWVCVGVTRNESLNRTVHLRCVGKRWRQERADDPANFESVIPNRFSFSNLRITGFPNQTGD